MFKLVYFVPDSHVAETKAAIFAAGGGQQGAYDACAWQTEGIGQFRPGANANPYLGSPGALERVPEWRVEVLCDDAVIRAAARALIASHPYEEPAYEIVRVWHADNLPADVP